MPSRLSDGQVVRRIRETVDDPDGVIIHPHARQAMEDEGLTQDDVRSVLRRGRLTRREVDMRMEERFTIEGPADDPGRTQLAVVCKLLDETPQTKTLVITVFDESTRWSRR